MYKVVLSEHAKQRLLEQFGTYRGAKEAIARRLIASLRLGVMPGPDLAVTVHLANRYKAICYPVPEGRWVVATVLEPEMVVVDREQPSVVIDRGEAVL